MKRWILLCSSVLVLWMAASASAELYSWTDKDGSVHYADQIDAVPPEYRDQVEVSKPVERPPTTWDTGVVPQSQTAKAEDEQASAIATLIAKLGLVKFVMYCVLGFIVFALIQIFILKKACRLVGENEPWGLGQSAGIVLLEWFVGALPNAGLELALHYGLLAADAAQAKMIAYLGALVVGIVLQVLVLRFLLAKSINGALQIWLGQILVTMFLAAILVGLGYLLQFCSGFMNAS